MYIGMSQKQSLDTKKDYQIGTELLHHNLEVIANAEKFTKNYVNDMVI